MNYAVNGQLTRPPETLQSLWHRVKEAGKHSCLTTHLLQLNWWKWKEINLNEITCMFRLLCIIAHKPDIHKLKICLLTFATLDRARCVFMIIWNIHDPMKNTWIFFMALRHCLLWGTIGNIYFYDCQNMPEGRVVCVTVTDCPLPRLKISI